MGKIILSGMENILLSESKFILSQVIFRVGRVFLFYDKRDCVREFLTNFELANFV